MDWALWLGIGIGIGWLLWARHGEPRHGDGHQPKAPPANRSDVPFGGYQPPIGPIDPARVQRPQGTAASLPCRPGQDWGKVTGSRPSPIPADKVR